MSDWAPIIPLNKRWGDRQMATLKLSYNELCICLELLRRSKDLENKGGDVASEQEKSDLKNKFTNAIAEHKSEPSATYEI